IVVAGWDANGLGFDLARYNPDGTPDTTFGTNGQVTTPVGPTSTAWAVVIQSDGKNVAAGQSWTDSSGNFQFAVARYNLDGSLYNRLGTGGSVVTPIGVRSAIRDMTLQSDGDIVVAGTSFATTPLPGTFAVARYLA